MRTRDRQRAGLTEARLEQLWSAGASMTEEEAFARGMAFVLPSEQNRAGEPRLTPRELEVLALLAAGKSDREIADVLFVTYRTANGYVARVLAKLEAPSRTAAATLAIRESLV